MIPNTDIDIRIFKIKTKYDANELLNEIQLLLKNNNIYFVYHLTLSDYLYNKNNHDWYEGYTGFIVVARTKSEAILLTICDVTSSEMTTIPLMNCEKVNTENPSVIMSSYSTMG